MSTPEEYLCTSRQSSSHSLASSAWAQTSSQNQQPLRHPTQLALMEHEFGGPAFEPAATEPSSPYVRCTPSAKVAQWETPTLVIQGDKDYRLVTSEAISTFTALQRQGVASELLFFPDENHHCLNPQNSLVWHDAVLAWCRRWT